MISLENLEKLVEELKKTLPKKDKFEEKDLLDYAKCIGLLSFISTESLYLVGDISKLVKKEPVENVQSVVFDKSKN